MIAENEFGTGGLKKKLDLRDRKWHKELGKSSIPFDWNNPFEISFKPIVKNQGGSFSCGGQSGSYLLQVLSSSEEKSARDIYSQIFYKGGGTTIRDIGNFAIKTPLSLESVVPSYQNGLPPTEAFMEVKGAIGGGSTFKVNSYNFVDANIESYAQAIRDNEGMIMEIEGQDNGTWRGSQPIAPSNNNTWRHFVFCVGAMTLNGKKFIKVLNSWGEGIGDKGYQYISEDYFNSGHVLQGLVLHVGSDSQTELVRKIGITEQMIALLQKAVDIFYTLRDTHPSITQSTLKT